MSLSASEPVLQAFSRGRHNVAFLIILSIFAAVAALAICPAPRATIGFPQPLMGDVAVRTNKPPVTTPAATPHPPVAKPDPASLVFAKLSAGDQGKIIEKLSCIWVCL